MCRRSWASAGLVMYFKSRSSRLRSRPSMQVAACTLTPSTRATRSPPLASFPVCIAAPARRDAACGSSNRSVGLPARSPSKSRPWAEAWLQPSNAGCSTAKSAGSSASSPRSPGSLSRPCDRSTCRIRAAVRAATLRTSAAPSEGSGWKSSSAPCSSCTYTPSSASVCACTFSLKALSKRCTRVTAPGWASDTLVRGCLKSADRVFRSATARDARRDDEQ